MHNKRLHILLYALLLAAVWPVAGAAKVIVNARLDSATILMGDRTALTVEILTDGEAGHAIDLPPLEVNAEQGYTDYCGVEIYQVQCDSTDLGNGRLSQQYRYSLQAFDPGQVVFPAPGFVSGADTVRAKLLTLTVQAVDVSVEGHPDSIRPIEPMYGVVTVKAKWYDWIPDWWPWVLVALLAIALAIFIAIMIRARKKGKPLFAAPKRETPPYELAVQRLERLRSERLAESGNEKEYYTRLTEILRQYLEGRFGINAMEMTSSQIRQHVNASPETRLPAKHIDELLRIADYVKFAKERPLPDDNVKSWNAAMQFVLDTKPVPVAPAADGATANKPN